MTGWEEKTLIEKAACGQGDKVLERSLMAPAEERAIKLREFWKQLVGEKKGFLELVMYRIM